MLVEPFLPQKVSAQEVDGDGNIERLMPVYLKETQQKTWGYKTVRDWFFTGIDATGLIPKQGVDREAALRHISAVLHSYKYDHGHKMQAAERLMTAWFEEPTS